MHHMTGSFVEIEVDPILLALLKYLVAHFVKHMDFLREKERGDL